MFLIDDSLLVFWPQRFYVLFPHHQMALKLDQLTLSIYLHVFTGIISLLCFKPTCRLQGDFCDLNVNCSRWNSNLLLSTVNSLCKEKSSN